MREGFPPQATGIPVEATGVQESGVFSSFLGSAGGGFFGEAQERPVLNTKPEAKPRNGIPRLEPLYPKFRAEETSLACLRAGKENS